MMKVLLLIASAFMLVNSKGKLTENEIKDASINCSKESGMDPSTLKRIVSLDTFPKPSDKYFKFLECMYSKQGYLDADGLISYETIEDFILDYYDPEIVKLALEPCVVEQQGNNGAERAYHAAKCLIRNLEELEQRYEKDNKDIKANLA